MLQDSPIWEYNGNEFGNETMFLDGKMVGMSLGMRLCGNMTVYRNIEKIGKKFI